MNFSDIQEFLSNNQFASGGLLIGVVGAAAAYCRAVPSRAWSFFKSKFVVSVEVLDSQEIHTWLNVWMSKHDYAKKSRRLVAWNKYPDRNLATTAERQNAKPEIVFSPSPGHHFVRHKGRWLLIEKERKENSSTSGMNGARFHESMTISMFGRERTFMESLFEEARDAATARKIGIECYMPRYEDWDLNSHASPRLLDSVVLQEGVAESVVADAKKFLESRDWYESVGIPFRRGYLFYGASGSGKSSLALAMASELSLKICVLSLGSTGMNDEKLLALIQSVPPGSIVLLEDIDCAFRGVRSRESSPENKNGPDGSNKTEHMTLSGFLNAIDGVASSEGQIVVMTTNYKERLDSAVIRPGRTDVKVELGNATKSQAKRIFLRFFPGEDDLANAFAASIQDEKHSMAEIQGHLISHRESAIDAASWLIS